MQFNWHAVPERERKKHKNSAEPVWSPTMAGGLFSIDKAFFEKLGTYDSGFDIWGGENLELSFKVFECMSYQFHTSHHGAYREHPLIL
jgi:polypeptide N-acetylgalactosaminyltransferase